MKINFHVSEEKNLFFRISAMKIFFVEDFFLASDEKNI
jgi:hypothetical protein